MLLAQRLQSGNKNSQKLSKLSVTHTSQHLRLIFCWQLVHVARNPGISKDFIFFVILEYYLINYVKFSDIYVLTTSPLASDNRVLVRKIDGE